MIWNFILRPNRKKRARWFWVYVVEVVPVLVTSIWIIRLNTFDSLPYSACWNQEKNHGRSVFIWQREIHSSRSNTAIDFTICEKCCNRCGYGCEVYSFGNIHHIQIVTISDHTAFFKRYSVPCGTSAISSKQFWIWQFAFYHEFNSSNLVYWISMIEFFFL